MRRYAAIGFAIIASTVFGGQREKATTPKRIEFEGRRWVHQLADQVTAEEHRGKSALHVLGQGATSVYLPEVAFLDGTIEVDIAASSRSTPGLGFGGRDKTDWRNKILFNHWPGRDHDDRESLEQAVVTRRAGTVIVLNIRESTKAHVRVECDGPEWFHVKVVVQGTSVEVFLNGRAESMIRLGSVLQNSSGVLGLCGEDFYFANFRFTPSP